MTPLISGTVVRGDGYGRQLGYPTLNLQSKDILPKVGVYAGTAALDGKSYRAGILINPTGKVEAHLIGYEGDLYGKMVTLEVGKFLREYKKFDSEAELKLQIKKDLEQC